MALNNRLTPFPKAWLAISMSWAAGFVDAAGWLVVYHVYTSHMTGNTATFARDVAERIQTVTGGLWMGFFAGALSETRFAMWALIAPLAVLSAAAAIDLRGPVDAADEAVETWPAH